MKTLLAVVCLFVLVACGGGGGGRSVTNTGGTMPEVVAPVAPEPAQRLPFPYVPSGHYSIEGLPRLAEEDAQNMPVYQDSHRLYVGIDQGTKYVDTFMAGNSIHHIQHDLASNLPVVTKRGDTEVRYGRLSDGVGSNVVSAYISEAGSNALYDSPPEVQVIGPSSAADRDRVIRAVQLVNAALPEGSKLSVGAPVPGRSLIGNEHGERPANTIQVEFLEAEDYQRNSASATWTRISGGKPVDNYIQFNKGANSYGRDREAVILLAHELMHAIGDIDHLPSRFSAIMEGTGAIHHTEQDGLRQPLSLLYPVDREALRALYDSVEDIGPWGAISTRIDGNGEHANFGVALRNGYAEPWAYGITPDRNLVANSALSGSVTWIGSLLGLTPQAEAVAGDARINVDLGSLAGRADFTGLESWAARLAPGDAGSGTQWLDGDLGYTIAVRGNTFRETGGDDGRLTGIFVGRQHDGAAGTLERDDLTAAFGAGR